MLSVALGAAAIAFMLTLARSGGATIMQGVEAAGGRGILVFQPSPSARGFDGTTFTERDAARLRDAFDASVEVFRLTSFRRQAVEYRHQRLRVDVGVGENYRRLVFPKLEAGRDIASDATAGRAEIVISHALAQRLFGGGLDALGATFPLWQHGYRVVGVASPETLVGIDLGGLSKDSTVFVSDAAVTLREGLDVGHYGLLRHPPELEHTMIVGRAKRVLETTHRTSDAFEVLDLAQLLKSFDTMLLALEILIGGIAALVLVVAGAGITNVSLASVSERVKEFGVRRALGASKASLRRQVLLESLALAGAGSVLGSAVGFGLSAATGWALRRSLDAWQHRLEPGVALLAVSAGLLVALVFGAHPARVAGRLDVIECLRGTR